MLWLITEMNDTTLPPDETDVETLSRNLDGPIAGLRAEIGSIGEDLTRLGHRYPVMCPAITDIKHRLTTMITHVRSLETTMSSRRQAGKEAAKVKQEKPEHYELPLTSSVRAPEISEETRKRMIQTLHMAGDRSLDDTEEDAP